MPGVWLALPGACSCSSALATHCVHGLYIFPLLCFSADGLKQSFFNLKSKNLLGNSCWPWLVSSGNPLLLLLLLMMMMIMLWVEGEDPGLHWVAGL